jgi:hypothetical protein
MILLSSVSGTQSIFLGVSIAILLVALVISELIEHEKRKDLEMMLNPAILGLIIVFIFFVIARVSQLIK